jgi:hypothetical protein
MLDPTRHVAENPEHNMNSQHLKSGQSRFRMTTNRTGILSGFRMVVMTTSLDRFGMNKDRHIAKYFDSSNRVNKDRDTAKS